MSSYPQILSIFLHQQKDHQIINFYQSDQQKVPHQLVSILSQQGKYQKSLTRINFTPPMKRLSNHLLI